MRALIIYSGSTARMKAIVQAISSAIRKGGNDVDEAKVGQGQSITSLYVYDLVYIGSPVLGFWGGKFPESLASYIKSCSGLEGKKTAAFVTPRIIGTTRTLRRIMKVLEEKGSIVMAFRTIKSLSEAKDFGDILSRIKK
ncbi:hypothetical protein LCGC14_1135290 [marine sediment metagenome]|uniref:Flavodoxin-like domain-containing protein n=1 Tax=marine sediment metagenome TaxID=412755 RepID=A0A0F9M002_9ZZZZ